MGVPTRRLPYRSPVIKGAWLHERGYVQAVHVPCPTHQLPLTGRSILLLHPSTEIKRSNRGKAAAAGPRRRGTVTVHVTAPPPASKGKAAAAAKKSRVTEEQSDGDEEDGEMDVDAAGASAARVPAVEDALFCMDLEHSATLRSQLKDKCVPSPLLSALGELAAAATRREVELPLGSWWHPPSPSQPPRGGSQAYHNRACTSRWRRVWGLEQVRAPADGHPRQD